MGVQLFNEQFPVLYGLQLANGDGTAVTLFTASLLQFQRIDHILASNSDAIPHVVNITALVNGNEQRVASASVPAGAGYGGAPPVDLFVAGVPAGFDGIPLASNVHLSAQLEISMTGATLMNLLATGGLLG
jgi:hypothetical protein